MNRTARVQDLGERIADKLDEIASMFNEPVRVTVIVRNPQHSDGRRDVLNSSEANPRQAIKAALHLLNDPTAEQYSV